MEWEFIAPAGAPPPELPRNFPSFRENRRSHRGRGPDRGAPCVAGAEP